MKFKKGEIIKFNNKAIKIVDILGSGGQGEVYLVNDGVKDLAFKSFFNVPSSDFKYNLKNNIIKGAPSDKFLWPKEYIEFSDETCGYFMDLRPKNYVSFVSYLNGVKKFKNKKIMLKWCLELCLAFKKLHEKGFSYQDLNDGAFFFDPDTGDLLICDNDNVTANQKNLGVLGKMRYMAPEVVRGDDLPDTHSDRFSLAIILFLTLCLGNPFEGKVLKNYDFVDEQSEMEMFGTKPLFIMHKTNTDNRPIQGYHTQVIKRWPTLPIYIKEAFHRTFVDGLVDRENSRVTEIEWIKYLCKFRDELLTCSCGNEFIYGFEENKINTICPVCHNQTKRFCYLNIGKHQIALEPNKHLYEFHLDKYSANYNKVVATVVTNKNNPSLFGIKLNVNESVEIEDVNGNKKILPPNGVIPIINNLNIDFNEQVKGIIKSNN